MQILTLKKSRSAQYNRVEIPNVAMNMRDIACDLFQANTTSELNDCTVGSYVTIFTRYEAPRIPNPKILTRVC